MKTSNLSELCSDLSYSKMETRRGALEIAKTFGLSEQQLLDKIARSSSLDLGCGHGELLLECERNGIKLDGFDAYPQVIGTAQNIITGSFSNMFAIPDYSYDLIICSRSLGTYAYGSYDLKQHLVELDRIASDTVLMTLEFSRTENRIFNIECLKSKNKDELFDALELATVWYPGRIDSFQVDIFSMIRLWTSFQISSAIVSDYRNNADWGLLSIELRK